MPWTPSRRSRSLLAAAILVALGRCAAPPAGSGHRLQPRHPADPLGQLLLLPRPRQEPPQGRSCGSTTARSAVEEGGDRPGQAGRERAGRRGSSPTTPTTLMPPPESHKKLTDGAEGAAQAVDRARGRSTQPHWAYMPPQRPPVPAVTSEVGCRTRSTRSSSRELEAKKHRAVAGGGPAHAAPPAEPRPDRPAADAGGGRGVRRRHVARTPTRSRSIGCSPRRTTASGWPCRGSTWCGSPTPSATTATRTRTSSRTATTSSTRSTRTSRSTSSRSSSSPATCCRTRRPSSWSPPASTG